MVGSDDFKEIIAKLRPIASLNQLVAFDRKGRTLTLRRRPPSFAKNDGFAQ
ncbi:hypothetical protein HZC09_02620 [Candidatus Micrarchaeota archaeon]|nr:hypothetical protein [Candidatus Micrarchaeota archaeon]